MLAEYTGLWVQDTISLGKMTINAGLRYDESGRVRTRQYELPAHPTRPDLIPGLSPTRVAALASVGNPSTPRRRLHLRAWARTATRSLRASYSQFADQLPTNSINRLSPLGYYFAFADSVTGDLIFTNVDPDDPIRVWNTVDSGLKTSSVTEILAGVEHSLLPELVVGLQLTARSIDDLTEAWDYVRDADGNRRLVQGSDFASAARSPVRCLAASGATTPLGTTGPTAFGPMLEVTLRTESEAATTSATA